MSKAMRVRRLLATAGLAAAVTGCGSGGESAGDLAALTASPSEGRAALDRILAAGDRRYVAPLIELLRADELGLGAGVDRVAAAVALEELTGRRFGSDWSRWVTWYADTELRPPPGFTAWKGDLLAQIDSRFERFFEPDSPSRIRVEEIVWGGVMLDGIPALDDPAAVAPAEAGYLTAEDPVFGVKLNGDARAYPLRILDWHEMANDVVGGVPVSLAYCTLCGAGVLYETETPDRTYTFGSSGFLMRSNKLMYDRQTNTLWNQLSGEPVHGSLADEEIELPVRPLVVTTWERWRRQHPDTRVLDVDTGFDRPYEQGAAYADYFASDEPLFPVARPGRGLEPKERLFALRVGQAPKAYPLDALLARRVVNDRVGGRRVVVVASGGRITSRGRAVRTGVERTYDSGAEVRAFERGGHTFEPGGGLLLRDERGGGWRVTEGALLGPGGRRLDRLGGHLAYAFGWLSYFPQTEVYGERRR